jgi:hypothetical protein
MLKRVTHRHIKKAVAELNNRRGLEYPSIGYLLYQDVGGWGVYAPSFYSVVNKDGGVTNVASLYRGNTMRQTLANIEAAIAAEE